MTNPHRGCSQLCGLGPAYELSRLLLNALVALVLMCQPRLMHADDAAKLARLGQVTNFALTDIDSQSHSQAAWRDANGVVVVFLGIQCPISNGYAQEFTRLAEYSAARGVRFIGIHGDPDVTTEQAQQHAGTLG